MCKTLLCACILVILLLWIAPLGRAQSTDTLLPPPSTEKGIYSEAQAEKGATLFEKHCTLCHQPEQFTGAGFMGAWAGQTVDAPFDVLRTSMPKDNPGWLKPREYAAILAFLFQLNGMPAGDTDLPSNTKKLKELRIDPPQNTENMP